MDLSDFLEPDPIVIYLQAENQWQAIDELVNCLVAKGKINPEDKKEIVEGVKKRETAMSTGIGFGIGLPHTSTHLVSEVIGIIGLSRQGVQFDALDGKPVHRVVLFLIPQGQFQKHLHTLANIAKMMHKHDFGDEV